MRVYPDTVLVEMSDGTVIDAYTVDDSLVAVSIWPPLKADGLLPDMTLMWGGRNPIADDMSKHGQYPRRITLGFDCGQFSNVFICSAITCNRKWYADLLPVFPEGL